MRLSGISRIIEAEAGVISFKIKHSSSVILKICRYFIFLLSTRKQELEFDFKICFIQKVFKILLFLWYCRSCLRYVNSKFLNITFVFEVKLLGLKVKRIRLIMRKQHWCFILRCISFIVYGEVYGALCNT